MATRIAIYRTEEHERRHKELMRNKIENKETASIKWCSGAMEFHLNLDKGLDQINSRDVISKLLDSETCAGRLLRRLFPEKEPEYQVNVIKKKDSDNKVLCRFELFSKENCNILIFRDKRYPGYDDSESFDAYAILCLEAALRLTGRRDGKVVAAQFSCEGEKLHARLTVSDTDEMRRDLIENAKNRYEGIEQSEKDVLSNKYRVRLVPLPDCKQQ